MVKCLKYLANTNDQQLLTKTNDKYLKYLEVNC